MTSAVRDPRHRTEVDAMTECGCRCHSQSSTYAQCSIEGGCGHLHRDRSGPRADECHVPRCGQPKPQHAFICNDDRRVLKQDLASVPGLVEDLLITISRQDVLGTSGGRRSAETSLPWKDHAATVLWDLNSTVTGWVRVLLEHYNLSSEVVARAYDGLSTHHRVTISASRWLAANIKSLVMHEAAGEAVDEIGHAVSRAYAAVDRPADKLTAGQCGVGGCEAYLYAEPHVEIVECPQCHTEHDMAERRAWMSGSAVECRVTATEAYGWITQLLGKRMPESTWRRWVAEGRVPHDDIDHLGHRLYRWGDVRDAVSDWVARPRRVKEEPAA